MSEEKSIKGDIRHVGASDKTAGCGMELDLPACCSGLDAMDTG